MLTWEEIQKIKEIRTILGGRDEDWIAPPRARIKEVFSKARRMDLFDWLIQKKGEHQILYEMLIELRMEEEFEKELKEIDQIKNDG